jgi:hypothetical protein
MEILLWMESGGANIGKNKLDTLAKHRQSASCWRFTPSKPLEVILRFIASQGS